MITKRESLSLFKPLKNIHVRLRK